MLSNNLTIEINRFEILNIRELFGKAELILISNNWLTIESRRWRRWSKTGDLHLVWMVIEVLIGRHPEIWIMSGDRSDVRVDRRVCEVFSASGFVQTQNGLVNGLCVWHRIYSVWHAKMQWSRLLLKSKVLWWWSKHRLCGVALCITWIREPHTPVWT